jgi:hypothetical protein
VEESQRAEASKSGQTSFSRVEYEIRSVTHDALTALVASLLGSLMPPFVEARRLGDLDCMGVDVYADDSETDLETITVQCKGFELQFLPEHLADAPTRAVRGCKLQKAAVFSIFLM